MVTWAVVATPATSGPASTVTVCTWVPAVSATSYLWVLPGTSGNHGLSTRATKSVASGDGVGITSSSTPDGGLGTPEVPQPAQPDEPDEHGQRRHRGPHPHGPQHRRARARC